MNDKPKVRVSMNSLISVLILIVIVMIMAAKPVISEPYQDGITFYQKKNYQAAVISFEQILHKNPGDTNSMYYLALCHQQMGDVKKAIALYAKLVASYSNTGAGQYAIRALEILDPKYLKQLVDRFHIVTGVANGTNNAKSVASHSPVSGSSELDKLPDEARIYFKKEGNVLCVEGAVNNRSINMVFDTGAEQTVFGKNHLRQLGIKPPEGAATSFAAGVGSSQPQKVWNMPVDIKVGTIERKHFLINVQEELSCDPLLGQSFFLDFVYTIDNGANSIHFQKKNKNISTSNKDLYAVPFKREGNELIVQVEVNGKSIPMYFDTGASGVAFSRSQAQKLNIPIPEDAIVGTNMGIGGQTAAFNFPINRMRMGPIDKSNIMISVIEQSNMRYPLLGQTFFGDWQYTIDNHQHVIRFVRR